jgi:hypothetical protein
MRCVNLSFRNRGIRTCSFFAALGMTLQATSARAQAPPACPDSLETRQSLAQMVSDAFVALRRSPDGPAPQGCLYAAIAKSPLSYTDSTILSALALSGETLRRSPGDRPTLSARLTLLYRARQYGEVGQAFDALFMVGPSRLTQTDYRLPIAAAMQLHDTTAIINRLANASQRFGSAALFSREYDVWRQLPRLRLVIDTVHHRLVAQPTLVEAYSILASAYGNLDQVDSALAYTRIALKRGVSRPVVGKALESLIGRELRRGELLGVPEVWEPTLAVALRIDSTLSTPAGKYLVALSMAELVADGARLAQDINYGIETGAHLGYARAEVRPNGKVIYQVMTCERLAELKRMVGVSRASLAAGGERFAPETIPAIRSGLDRASAIFSQIGQRCP